MLLTSVALTLGALTLARKKTLVQELYCIETLARVDTLCLDKTGTITEGTMCVEKVEAYDSNWREAELAESILEEDEAGFPENEIDVSKRQLLYRERNTVLRLSLLLRQCGRQ